MTWTHPRKVAPYNRKRYTPQGRRSAQTWAYPRTAAPNDKYTPPPPPPQSPQPQQATTHGRLGKLTGDTGWGAQGPARPRHRGASGLLGPSREALKRAYDQGLSRQAFKRAVDCMRNFSKQRFLSGASGLLGQLALPQTLGAGGAPEPGPPTATRPGPGGAGRLSLPGPGV